MTTDLSTRIAARLAELMPDDLSPAEQAAFPWAYCAVAESGEVEGADRIAAEAAELARAMVADGWNPDEEGEENDESAGED